MPKTQVYNMEGKKVGDQTLSDAVFAVALKPALIHEVVVAQQANSRTPVAHTKTRGEVRGGGRKPWRQKGTGRARHGSIRSPLWIGGGVTFGPSSKRNFSKKLNRKVKRAALRMVLSDKVADNRLVVLDAISISDYKTKTMQQMLKSLPVQGRRYMVILPKRDEKIIRSLRNIPAATTQSVTSMNVVDLLRYDTIVTTTEAVEKMEATLAPQTK